MWIYGGNQQVPSSPEGEDQGGGQGGWHGDVFTLTTALSLQGGGHNPIASTMQELA